MNTQITLPKMPEYTPPSSPTPPPVYSLFNHPPIPEYPQFPDWYAICSDDDHEYDSDCDCEDCCEEELERRDEPTGGGNCMFYYLSPSKGMSCINCEIEHTEMPIRLCDQKLLADYEKKIKHLRYCNAHYEPAFDIWLCHNCGEIMEYNGKPRTCHETLYFAYCELEVIDWDADIWGNCIHCGSKYEDTMCEVQDKTKCECDRCMTLYSRFRNNRTKSARN